ncbi:MAG: hypothetical protein EZS28_056454 [Streblomastix strix]|uniref:Uncharacterized protein n=1 Tax=Streblomastix strix TaxID=222440 RepID=A0A5J4PLH7_9EUKA|nr:MAG: hypothetical protein EZS28_056454 [Streblomastix strix]
MKIILLIQQGLFGRWFICTPLPLIGLFDKVARVAGELFHVLRKPIGQSIFEEIDKWPSPIAGQQYSVRLWGESIEFQIPSRAQLGTIIFGGRFPSESTSKRMEQED